MARNHTEIDAPARAVYEVLLDADAYPRWVVGARRVRGVDRRWPRRGAKFHHAIGIGAAEVQDSTKLVDKETDRRVELEVRARPLFAARVVIDLAPLSGGDRTAVTMTESPTADAPAFARNRIADALVGVRNVFSLRRLRGLVTSRN